MFEGASRLCCETALLMNWLALVGSSPGLPKVNLTFFGASGGFSDFLSYGLLLRKIVWLLLRANDDTGVLTWLSPMSFCLLFDLG